ncbi:MAG: response regulator transcription factor [Acidimicrobiia bacterium]|nr:response regulator transcription factor [Acidimicrobiia bacterium]
MRVVLADDHGVVRTGLRWMLEPHEGIEVVGEASSAGELLDLLPGLDADVVLLDIRMPGTSGLDLLPVLGERHPDLRVIVVSMHDEPGFIRTAVERGADGYLLKSAALDELLAALRAVDAGKAYVQPALTRHLMDQLSGDPAAAPTLTDRQESILRLIAEGASNAAIANATGVSEATVKADVAAALDLLGASTRVEAVATALRLGLID